MVILMLIVVFMVLLLATVGFVRPSVLGIYVVSIVFRLPIVGLIVAWPASPWRVSTWLVATRLRMPVVDIVTRLAVCISTREARAGMSIASTWLLSRCRRCACMSLVRLGMRSCGVRVWPSVMSPCVIPSVMRKARARFGPG